MNVDERTNFANNGCIDVNTPQIQYLKNIYMRCNVLYSRIIIFI